MITRKVKIFGSSFQESEREKFFKDGIDYLTKKGYKIKKIIEQKLFDNEIEEEKIVMKMEAIYVGKKKALSLNSYICQKEEKHHLQERRKAELF
jgi:hypothetical protein